MRKTILMSLLAGTALLAQSASDFYPLQVGNQWVYQPNLNGRPAGEAATAAVVRTSDFGGRTYYQYNGIEASAGWLRIDAQGTMYVYDQQSGTERIAVGANGEVTPFPNPCNQVGRVVSTNADYKGPIGVFRGGVIEVQYDPGTCRDAGIEHEFYLPYVGLVQRTVQTIAGPRTYDLIYARLGGVTVVSGPEISFTVALDSTRYEVLSPMRVRLALRNTTGEPVRLEFPSGQEFDIIIRNERGETVYVWSADKVFIQELHTIDVTGERNWVATVALAAIPAGRYTAEALLTTTVRQYSGTAGFTVAGPEPAKP